MSPTHDTHTVSYICPKKNMSFVVGGDFEAGRRGGDQVRGTKYEVKELGATRLRR